MREAVLTRLHLRPETAADEAFSLDLFARARAGELSALALALDPGAREVLLRLQEKAQRRGYQERYPGAAWSIVVLGGAPAGRIVVDRAETHVRLIDVALLPEHRARGLGTRLLADLLDEAGRAGKPVLLCVRKTNRAAHLYERLGFVRIGGSDLDDEMRWPAAPA